MQKAESKVTSTTAFLGLVGTVLSLLLLAFVPMAEIVVATVFRRLDVVLLEVEVDSLEVVVVVALLLIEVVFLELVVTFLVLVVVDLAFLDVEKAIG